VLRTGKLLLLVALAGLLVAPGVGAEPEFDRLAQLPAGQAAYGLAVGPDEALYLSDSSGVGRGIVYVYATSGQARERIPVQAHDGQTVALRGLVFDRRGNLYLADAGDGRPNRGRIVKISTRGHQSVVADDLSAPLGLALDRDEILYVTDGLNGAIRWIGPDGASALFVEDNRLASNARGGLGAAGLAFSANGNSLYITNAADDRLLRLAINDDGSAGKLSVLADGPSLRREGRGSGVLDGPEAVVVDSRGNILVAASRSDEIDLFSPEGRLLQRLRGSGEAKLSSPTGLALAGRYGFVVNLAAEHGLSHLSRFPLEDLYGQHPPLTGG
jgi:sugar lactone lactonase YvrE